MVRTFRILGIILAGAAIGGCAEDVPKGSPQMRDSVIAPAPEGNSGRAAAERSPAGITMLPFDAKSIAAEYPFRGEAIGGARWKDASGENVLIVSTSSTQQGDASMQELFGYHYAITPDTTRTLWTIRDFAENNCDRGAGLVSDVVVRDLDGDGVAENAFVYNVQGSCDVSPVPFKLMLHSSDRKYALRGTSSVMPSTEPGARPEGGEKNFDAAFDTAPPEFRAFADSLWNAAIKKSSQP